MAQYCKAKGLSVSIVSEAKPDFSLPDDDEDDDDAEIESDREVRKRKRVDVTLGDEELSEESGKLWFLSRCRKSCRLIPLIPSTDDEDYKAESDSDPAEEFDEDHESSDDGDKGGKGAVLFFFLV